MIWNDNNESKSSVVMTVVYAGSMGGKPSLGIVVFFRRMYYIRLLTSEHKQILRAIKLLWG